MPNAIGDPGAWADAVAASCTFAATIPLGIGGVATRFVRAGFAVTLVLVLIAGAPQGAPSVLAAALRGGAIGAALGLSATVVFSAAEAAGSLTSSALAWSPLAVPAAAGGPIALLYQLGFALVLFGSGGFDVMLAVLARANASLPAALFTLHGVASLAGVAAYDSLALAAPALFAQVLAALAAGWAVRAAAQVGGLLASSPVMTAAVGVALLAGSGSLFERFESVVRESLPLLTFH